MGLGKKITSGEQGQALVEFSFICIILLMLAGGVADSVNIMRHQIALHGAATEVVNQLSRTSLEASEVYAVCHKVIKDNFEHSLGDGNTTYNFASSTEKTDTITYRYHDEAHGEWSGNRVYVTATVTLERNQTLLTPFGQLVFGNSGGGSQRHMTVSAQTRVYMDSDY